MIFVVVDLIYSHCKVLRVSSTLSYGYDYNYDYYYTLQTLFDSGMLFIRIWTINVSASSDNILCCFFSMILFVCSVFLDRPASTLCLWACWRDSSSSTLIISFAAKRSQYAKGRNPFVAPYWWKIKSSKSPLPSSLLPLLSHPLPAYVLLCATG